MSGLITFPVECKYQAFSFSSLTFPTPVPVTAVVSARGDIRVQGVGSGSEGKVAWSCMPISLPPTNVSVF
jgi:hypothetical protein